MLRPYSLLLAVFCNLAVLPFAMAADEIGDFAGQFTHAQFIDDNANALKFRLGLLDHAATGSHVRIATFTFDVGAATQALGAHMCAAVARGVSVELIVDSKSGEVQGIENPYNSTDAGKQTEQAYQDLANCGVKLFIHNYTTDFVTVSLLGKRIPNIFDASVKTGSSVNPLTLLNRLKAIRARLVQVLGPVLQKNHVAKDPGIILADLQDFVLNLAQLSSLRGQQTASADDTSGADPLEPQIRVLSGDYRGILDDPFWDQFSQKNPADSFKRLEAVRNGIITAMATDPVLKPVRDALRIFNRLNHRKLFLVEQPSGESCVIIGGRNLGDLYLTNSAASYRDGDVFMCTRHATGTAAFFAEANASLDQLKNDTTDPVLKAGAKVVVKQVRQLKKATPARVNAVSFAGLKGLDLGEINSPVLLTSNWQASSDGVSKAVLEGIIRETKEVYIETAYAEFNSSMREAIEIALKKGVKVRIVTNSLFISDGASQMIRLWMANWNEEMAAKYPHLFEVDFAPLSAGHMIHFKGAAFRCQKGALGTTYRKYIVGSHNFHPRSGYSDKEHAIEWRETVDASCPDPASDLITLRTNYYRQQTAAIHGAPVLIKYESLIEELQEVSARYDDPTNADIARVIRRTMYSNDVLIEPKRLDWIQELLDRSGLRDLIGIIF